MYLYYMYQFYIDIMYYTCVCMYVHISGILYKEAFFLSSCYAKRTVSPSS